MARSLNAVLVAFTLVFVTCLTEAQSRFNKIVIFYSSIGMGHISAARAIEVDIKQRDPNAIVILKNIRDFMSSERKEKLDEKIYWTVVKRFPNLFDKAFRDSMNRGNLANSLEQLPKDYDENRIREFIVQQNPTSILATHYGSAQTLGNLKAKGFLSNIPIGWLHTDYFTGYFPRISQQLEQTFVPMPQMKVTWEEKGVPAENVVTTGMPVNPALFESLDRVAYLKSKKLNPDIRTITLASGGEGVGDFPLIVRKLSEDVPGPLQIIAICANNEKHFKDLTTLKSSLRSDVTLVIEKKVPNIELLNYIKSSDLYITKSGGLSPTEGFAITRPMVLLDVYGGHERDNADLFEKEGLAYVNRRQDNIGLDVRKVLESPELQARMIEQQSNFRNSFNLKAITDFVLGGRHLLTTPEFHLGLEGGAGVSGSKEALARLEEASPADVEILLAYGKSHDGKYFTANGNPFGHLAVRIGETVFTANGLAELNVETNQIHSSTLEEYLYGTTRPAMNVEHTDAFGSAYGRDNISLRVSGVDAEHLLLMKAEVSKIENEWATGKLKWSAKGFNCADFVARILKAGGLRPENLTTEGESAEIKGKRITMPLDVFEAYRELLEKKNDVRTEIIAYSAVPGSKNEYRTTRFPLSIHQIRRSLRNFMFSGLDQVERQVGKRLAIYHRDATVRLENVNGISVKEEKESALEKQIQQKENFEILLAAEAKIEEMAGSTEQDRLRTQKLQDQISTTMNRLDDREFKAVASGNVGEIKDEVSRARVKSLMAQIREWDDQQKALLAEKDNLIKMELDYFIEGMNASLTQALEEVKASGNVERTKQLQSLYNESQKHFLNFKNGRSEYGEPKDGPLRTEPYRLYFAAAKTYRDTFNTASDLKKEKEGFWTKISKKSRKLFTTTRALVKITPRALSLIFNVYFRPATPAGKAPVIGSIDSLMNTLAKELGITVKIEGQNFLPKSGALTSKTVYLVTPTHRDPILDTIAMANLGLEKSLLVMATDQIVTSKGLADRFAGVDSIVTVGRGSDEPINKIMEQLAAGKSNTILIYPEGSVSAGLSETRPLRAKFSNGLIQRLMKDGYDVQVIPVTYKNSARFAHEGSVGSLMQTLGETDSLELQVKVNAPIDSRMIKALEVATGSSDTLNRFIRSLWLENMDFNSSRLLGLLRPVSAADAFKQKMGVNMRPLPRALRCGEALASGH